MRDDRPAVSSFADRAFSATLSFVTRPSGRPGRYLPAGTRLAGTRHRQKIRDSGAGRMPSAKSVRGPLRSLVEARSPDRHEDWGQEQWWEKDPAYEKRLPTKIGSL